MAIQILGLRDYEVHGKIKKKEDFFYKKWRAESVPDLFNRLDEYMNKIWRVPQEERINLYYTAASCVEDRGRRLERQEVIPFDVDDIDILRAEDYIPVVCNAIGIKRKETAIVMSGNGLQFIVGIKEPITDEHFFGENRKKYKELCNEIDKGLRSSALPGHADASVFSAARLLRLPNTLNVKIGKESRAAHVIESKIVPIHSPISSIEGEDLPPPIPKPQAEVKDKGKRYDLLPLDREGVLTGCDFIKFTKINPTEVKEPQWYSMLSILGRIDRKIAHEYSAGHSDYSYDECDSKIDQALEASGPITCEHISTQWSGCEGCKHYKKVKSPISIRRDAFIRSKELGFRTLNLNKNPPTQGKPDYSDLLKYFSIKHPYVSLAEYRSMYTWNGKYWESYPLNKVKAFAEQHIDYPPTNSERVEFLEKSLVNNMKDQEFLNPYGYANFQNGMLRLPGGKSTGELLHDMEAFKLYDHDPALGLTYILPFDYGKEEDCPRFKKFIKEVTCDDPTLEYVLQEYMGYALSNSDPELGERALFLLGEGSNGKSVFLDVMKWLAGDDNYSSVPIDQLEKETSRFELYGKLFNVTEETPRAGLKDSSIFKNLVTGGTMIIRQLYKDPMTVKNKTKLIMAANELPRNQDVSKGMFRKILIVPFNATFEGEKIDRGIRQKLKEELPGIFNWAMEGYERLRKNSFHFTASTAVSNEVSLYQDLSDPLRAWCRENVSVVDDDVFTPIEELYAKYVIDMEADRLHVTPKNSFGLRLKKIFKFKKTQRKLVDGRRLNCMYGIRLSLEEDYAV